ncbi:MAG: cytochrome c [Chloroflexi bacterium]|nr:cytochrome c [Chloroflexota bacterium]
MGAIEKQVAITLASVLLMAVLGVGYVLIEPYWRAQRAHEMQKHSASLGQALFESQGCVTCHLANGYGTLQGGAGWPLNTTQNQQGSDPEMLARHDLLTRTIDRGRGPVMAPYGRDNGGPLNSEQIQNIIDYIQHGTWPVAPVQGAAATLVQGGATAPAGGGTPSAGGGQGAQLFAANGCAGCHQVGGQGGTIGPNLSNIGTTAATRVPGKSAEEYIRESITSPNAHVVQGYTAGLMPVMPLQPADLDALVKYLAEQK